MNNFNINEIARKYDPLNREYAARQIDTIDVELDANGPTFYLDNFPELSDSIITGLQIPRRGSSSARAISSGNILINDSALDTGYLTLQTKDGVRMLDRVPLRTFTDDTLGTQPYFQLWIPQELNVNQCFVEFANDGAALADDETLQMVWYFLYPKNL